MLPQFPGQWEERDGESHTKQSDPSSCKHVTFSYISLSKISNMFLQHDLVSKKVVTTTCPKKKKTENTGKRHECPSQSNLKEETVDLSNCGKWYFD